MSYDAMLDVMLEVPNGPGRNLIAVERTHVGDFRAVATSPENFGGYGDSEAEALIDLHWQLIDALRSVRAELAKRPPIEREAAKKKIVADSYQPSVSADEKRAYARIEDSLTKLGSEHSPPEGWTDKILAAVDARVSEPVPNMTALMERMRFTALVTVFVARFTQASPASTREHAAEFARALAEEAKLSDEETRRFLSCCYLVTGLPQ